MTLAMAVCSALVSPLYRANNVHEWQACKNASTSPRMTVGSMAIFLFVQNQLGHSPLFLSLIVGRRGRRYSHSTAPISTSRTAMLASIGLLMLRSVLQRLS